MFSPSVVESSSAVSLTTEVLVGADVELTRKGSARKWHDNQSHITIMI
jgi:hypothetical protein